MSSTIEGTMIWAFSVIGVLQLVSGDTCTTNYTYQVQNSNLICGCCLPGFYKEADCQESNKSAKCVACPGGHYSLYRNQATSCQPCTTSCTMRYSELVKNCTAYSDIRCQCVEGFHMTYRSQNEGFCAPHTKCMPGFYVKKLGTPTNNTVCAACPSSTFQDKSNLEPQCKNCSTCSTPSAELAACSSQKDTQCDEKPVSQNDGEGGSSSTEAVVGAVVGVVLLLGVILVVVVVCHRRGHPLPCLREGQGDQSEEDMSFSNKQRPLDHEEVLLTSPPPPSENGHHQYTPVITDPKDSPKKAPSRRQLVEKAWDDLCILLQKELQIKEWRFIIRELYAVIDKKADAVLDELAENHPRDVKEQIYKSLQSFGQKTDLCSFDFQEFINILTNNSHSELADMIEKDHRFSPLFPSDSVEGNMSEFNNVSRTQ
ncbi:uncharacterized protein LOC111135959 isoform X2 [Crassostrea virginica]